MQVLSQSREVVRSKKTIVQTVHGFVMANAGIDQSNLDPSDHNARVSHLLPADPDASAAALTEARRSLRHRHRRRHLRQRRPGVAARKGRARHRRRRRAVAVDRRGEQDMSGRTLEVTEVAFADGGRIRRADDGCRAPKAGRPRSSAPPEARPMPRRGAAATKNEDMFR